MTSIYLVRHGETEWNQEKIFRGTKDVALSKNGKRHAAALARALADKDIRFIFSSPLKRSLETARVISRKLELPVQTMDGLTDINFGEWEGKALDQVREQYPELFQAWMTNPADLLLPGGETLTRARNRMMGSLEKMVNSYPDSAGVVVTHRVLCKLALLVAVGSSESNFWKVHQDLGCLNLLEWDDNHWAVRFMNLTSHLKDDGSHLKMDF